MRSIFFHEDDYCQIEIVPVANLDFCRKQAGLIDEFAVGHKAGTGYTDMYVREQAPAPTRSLELPFPRLDAALRQKLPRYDEVTTGYGSHSEVCENTAAYGHSNHVALFCDFRDGVVQNIWLELLTTNPRDVAQAKDLLAALRPLGDFLLADWGWSVVLPLSEQEALDAYLEERLEEFSGAFDE